MFEVSVEQTFAAGHALRNYKGSCENVHGHNFKVMVTIEGQKLDHTGLLIDFLDLKASMQGIIAKLDHQFLNDIAPFDVLNPSAENMAEYFYNELARDVEANPVPVKIREVKVWETEIQSATYRP
jgi:6-pyruvoyltetrahydropterin/6-carboxytetrahydropterin synthase